MERQSEDQISGETKERLDESVVKRPKRRWFQFSLRTLLLMMLVAMPTFSGLAWQLKRRSESKQAWQRIADEEELEISFSGVHQRNCWGPKKSLREQWLEEWLWVTFPVPTGASLSFSEEPQAAIQILATYPDLKELDFSHLENLTDEAIYSIPKLPSLTQLKIENCPLTGVSLGHLATACPKLETLILNEVPLTPEGLQEIGTIHSLKSLTLDESGVTSDGLGYLNDLTQLQEISFYGAFINDLGLEHLSKHPHLENLSLQRTAITDAGMTHVSVLQELKSVNLEDTLITDQGLQQLQSQKLETLRLNYTSITDAGVSQLTRFNHLRFLRLSRTKITDACVPELAKLPQLEVLAIDKTAITDEALSSLSHHRSLKALILPQKLKGTPGVNSLQQNNPGLDISFL